MNTVKLLIFCVLAIWIVISGFEVESKSGNNIYTEYLKYDGAQPVTKSVKPTGDFEFWLIVVSGLAAITIGLITMGVSAWLIIAVLLGMLLYLGFITFLFALYLVNGFELEGYWWLILLGILGLGIWGAIAVAGISVVSGLIISYLVWFAVGLAVIVVFFMMIASFFRALFSPFRRRN